MATKKAIFVHSHKLEKYEYPAECPFNISRAGKVRKIISSMRLLSGTTRYEAAPKPAERTVLEKFHSSRYLDALQAAAKGDFDVESLYVNMKNKNYRVSRATVYNSLDLLVECDLVSKHQFGRNLAQYEKSYGFKLI